MKRIAKVKEPSLDLKISSVLRVRPGELSRQSMDAQVVLGSQRGFSLLQPLRCNLWNFVGLRTCGQNRMANNAKEVGRIRHKSVLAR